MGVTLHFPIGAPPFVVFNAIDLPKDVELWLNTHVGDRGEDWGASFNWYTMCWDISFTTPNQAMLFKLTWM